MHDEQQTDGVDAAERLLAKVRLFASSLEGDERELFAALRGPGAAFEHESRHRCAADRTRQAG